MSSSEMVVVFPIILLIIFLCLAFFIHIVDSDLQLAIDSRGVFAELYGLEITGRTKSSIMTESNLISKTALAQHEPAGSNNQKNLFTKDKFPLIETMDQPLEVTFYGISRHSMFLMRNLLTEAAEAIQSDHKASSSGKGNGAKDNRNENVPSY